MASSSSSPSTGGGCGEGIWGVPAGSSGLATLSPCPGSMEALSGTLKKAKRHKVCQQAGRALCALIIAGELC